MRILQKYKIIKKELNRNSGAEEYSEINEKYNKEHKQQTGSSRRKLEDRNFEIRQSEGNKEKNEKE